MQYSHRYHQLLYPIGRFAITQHVYIFVAATTIYMIMLREPIPDFRRLWLPFLLAARHESRGRLALPLLSYVQHLGCKKALADDNLAVRAQKDDEKKKKTDGFRANRWQAEFTG